MYCNTEHEASLSIFECKQCGDCCKGYGGTYMTGSDIEGVAGYLGIDPDTFIPDYCTPSGSKYVLKQKEGGYCVFWDSLCTIHPVKPLMCRAWPFIPGVLIDYNNWRIMAGSCPGIRTDVPESTVRRIVGLEVRKLYDRKRLKQMGVA